MMKFSLMQDGSFSVSVGESIENPILSIPAYHNGTPVTEIQEDGFANIESIEKIIIEDGIKKIGKGAFKNCRNVKEIILPDSITSIGFAAFENCESLECMEIPFGGNQDENSRTSRFGYIFGSESSYTASLHIPCSLSVLKISGCKKIYSHAFEECRYIEHLLISDDIQEIGKCAFKRCDRLIDVKLGNGVQKIRTEAFYDCGELSDICFGSNVSLIEEYAFHFCDKLTKIHIQDIAAWCKIKFDGYYANPMQYANGRLYLNEKEVDDLHIPLDVLKISAFAFYGCSSLLSVILHNQITSIGQYAFGSCKNLQKATLPFIGATSNSKKDADLHYVFDSIPSSLHTVFITGKTKIKKPTLGYFGDVTNIVLGEDVYEIESSAFEENKKLTGIELGIGIKKVPSYAFQNCKKLRYLTVANEALEIGRYAFEGCDHLEQVTVKSNDGREFISNDLLNKIILQHSLDTIDISKNLRDKLYDGEIYTLGQLTSKKPSELLKIDGIGPTKIQEIGAALSKYNFCLQSEEPVISKIRTFRETPFPQSLLLDLDLLQSADELVSIDIINGVDKAMSFLDERSKEMLFMRYKEHQSFGEIGTAYEISGTRVQQIIIKSLRFLRHPERYKYMKHGLNGLEEKNREVVSKAIEKVGAQATKSIEELNFSVRTYNVLTRAGIETLGELILLSEDDLMKIRNMGRKSFEEIIQKLEFMEIKLNTSE